MNTRSCPYCGRELGNPRNPAPTADMIIYDPERGIVLVKRRFPPPGWALPGGFVDYGERVERAAVREALEETGLEVELKGLVGVYSDPTRDPRQHTISTVYWGICAEPGRVKGGDDAAEARFFPPEALPEEIAFDHAKVIDDFFSKLKSGKLDGQL